MAKLSRMTPLCHMSYFMGRSLPTCPTMCCAMKTQILTPMTIHELACLKPLKPQSRYQVKDPM